MDNKIFLGKYRVSGDEIEAMGESAGSPLAYEAQEIHTRKKVVVELVPAGDLKVTERERLEAEATAAKKLNHVNIPTLHDFGVEEDYLVYVTEDFDGTLAEEWVNTYGPLSAVPVLRIASQVVSALDAAALHQIVHQAINPNNLVLVAGQTAEDEWPMVKVLHFGGVAPTLSDTGATVATFDKSLHYVSPEQIRKGTVDFRSEIFSLGATLWFLLTGTPPLAGPGGPMAVASATARWTVKTMPKKVRRLLAQMISVSPQARPRDPVEFNRKLQDCLLQAERREARSGRFETASFSQAPAEISDSRWRPMKALALATLLLITAALTAVVIEGYLRHGRVVRAEESIGLPIGVPSAVTAATPTDENETNAIASNSTETTSNSVQADSARSAPAQGPNRVTTSTTPVDASSGVSSNLEQTTNTMAQSNLPSSVPAEVQSTVAAATPAAADTTNAIASNSSQTAGTVARPNYPPTAQVQGAAGDNTGARPRASASAERTDQDQVAASRAQRPIAPSVANSQTQEPVVAANSTGTAASSPENASANRASRPAVQSSDINTQQSARKKFTMHEVRRAEPAEPDVKRAEPVPPAEGPDAETPERGASSKRQSNSAAQIEESQRSRNVENEATENTSRAEKPANSEPNVAARPPTKSERTKPKQWTEEKAYPPQPMPEIIAPLPRSAGRSVRARFVGVTPDGRWMVQLPSNKIIIVAPPRTSH